MSESPPNCAKENGLWRLCWCDFRSLLSLAVSPILSDLLMVISCFSFFLHTEGLSVIHVFYLSVSLAFKLEILNSLVTCCVSRCLRSPLAASLKFPLTSFTSSFLVSPSSFSSRPPSPLLSRFSSLPSLRLLGHLR